MRKRRGGHPIEFKFSRKFGWGSHLVQVRVRKSDERNSRYVDPIDGCLPVNIWRPLTVEIRGDMLGVRHSGVLTPDVRGPFVRDMRVMARAFWAPVAEEVIEKVRPFREYIKEIIRRGESL